jgi:GNAT superfamily N-acetyltransferase
VTTRKVQLTGLSVATSEVDASPGTHAWSRRAAEATDVDAVHGLVAGALRELDEEPSRDAFRAAFAPAAWTIVEGAAGIAAVVRVERKRHEIVVHDLVVAPAEQSRGLATAAIRELIDEAVRSDIAVAIHVSPRAARAVRLLKLLGFVVVPSAVAGRTRFIWRA